MNPVEVFAKAAKRPCSHLTAVWIIFFVLGLVPDNVTSWKAWWRLAQKLFEDINVWDPTDPWSGVRAVAGALGLPKSSFVHVGEEQEAPDLEEGIWYYVQKWESLDPEAIKAGNAGGHSYLIMKLPDGKFRWFHSSAGQGFRDQNRDWWLGYDDFGGFVPLKGYGF